MVALDPGATLELVQDTGAELGQFQPLPALAETETKVVLAGVASVKVAEPQLLGPAFDTTCV